MKQIAICVAAFAALPLYAQAREQDPGTVISGTPASGTQTPVTPGTAGSGASLHMTPGDAAGTSYAQYLVDTAVARHPELVQLDVHATAPGTTQSTVIAAKTRDRVGQVSDIDDVEVSRTSQPRVRINHHGDDNVEVALPLFDIYRKVIGSVEFTLPYPPGTDQDALVAKAAQYREEMSRRILDSESLTAPVQTDVRINAHAYAQYLVDDTVARYPEVEVVTVHARTPRTSADYPIIASNIARIGKPADAGDLSVIETGVARNAADAEGTRYESKLPLLDASGNTLGALGVVFPYGRTSNAETLRRQAEKIRDEMRARITSAAALEQPYPAAPRAEESRAVEKYNSQELGNKQDLPMTKEVVSGRALQQSTQEGYSEAIKNVAGVQPTNSTGSANDAFSIRGIKLNLFSNYRLDGGLPVTGVITNPTENKQRVETLKGANALMFGVASPAGIINFVTKRAGPRDTTSFGFAGNSFGQYGASFDIGRRYSSEKQ
ncbi:MAG TPA: TonB-dependent receptor plug domain-containing protein, partial [Casimicrobiaceae bacterium]|nr:TonB-dependent receptor plug domain-containing protein [Casimicrobiaceae bacterium]